MTSNTPEATVVPIERVESAEPETITVEMSQYGTWRVVDASGKWDIQRAFLGYREACLMRDSLIAYDRGEVEVAGQLNQRAVQGEAWLRREY